MTGAQRLGNNTGGYFGEAIDLDAVLQDCLAAARQHGWQIQSLAVAPGIELHALHRPATTHVGESAPARIYLSTGIHGDEPAGPRAMRQLLRENLLPAGADLWVCPCLNPTGFPLNRRENASGVDLNRDYRHLQSAEIRTHTGWLRQQPNFDVCFCLHEDWESHGFYVYELNPDQCHSLAKAMVNTVAQICPIDRSTEIEGRPAKEGIINPNLDPNSRPQWPEAFFLIQNKTRLSYTLEAPSDFSLPVRVAALVTAVRAALEEFGRPKGGGEVRRQPPR